MVADGVAYVPSHGVTAIRPGESTPNVAEILWQEGGLNPGTSSLAVHKGKVYLISDSGVLSCADAKTGKREYQARLPKGHCSGSPIIAGDFNAEPDSTEIRYVKGLHALDGRSVHFHDAWAIAGDGAGITWSSRNPYARQALEPDRRIDYVFAGRPLANGIGLIESCRVVCDMPEDGIWPSDHFGVYAELRSEPLRRAGDET